MSNPDSDIYTVERIEKKRIKNGQISYYVKWMGYPDEANTWECEDNIFDKRLIDNFNSNKDWTEFENWDEDENDGQSVSVEGSSNNQSKRKDGDQSGGSSKKLASTSTSNTIN